MNMTVTNLTTPWYDDIHEMLSYVNDLTKLHELIDARREHRKKYPNDRMQEWIVRGRFVLDTFGQVQTISQFHNKEFNNIEFSYYNFPTIVRKEGIFKFIPEGGGYTSSFEYKLPTADNECQCCHKKWKLEDIEDVYTSNHFAEEDLSKHIGKSLGQVIAGIRLNGDVQYTNLHRPTIHTRREDGKIIETISSELDKYDFENHICAANEQMGYGIRKFYHKTCFQRMINSKIRNEFLDAINKSNLPVIDTTATENKYGSDSYRGQWIEINTPEGKIVVGWRKSVININYENVNSSNLFSDYETTNGTGYVHVYSHEDLIKVLNTISEKYEK